MKNAGPTLRDLSESEIRELLERNSVGRFAYAWHDKVGIEPLHYVYEAPWIYGRTEIDAKLVALTHNQWCAVEVDEVRGLFDWRSVVIKGPFTVFNSSLGQDPKYDIAVRAFQQLIPGAFTSDDPTPERGVVFGVHASEVTGKMMTPGPRVTQSRRAV